MEYSSKIERYLQILFFMLDLNETIDQLAMAYSVCLYGHVLRREGGYVLRHIAVESQRKKGGLKGILEKQVN